MSRQTLLGLMAVLTTVLVYAVNFAISRYSLLHGMSSHDIVALRFLVAGLVLLPYFLRLGLADLGGLGWRRALVITYLAGAPYMVIFVWGLSLAPASHGAVLNPGMVPSVVFVTTLALGLQRFSRLRFACLLLILVGLMMVTRASFSATGEVLRGDVLLFASGVSWGLFTVCVMRWQIKPLHAAAVTSVLSLPYLVVYALVFYDGLPVVSSLHLAGQAVLQGLALGIGTIFLTAYAVGKLGAQTSALFNPLVPLVTALIAIPLLGEVPDRLQWMGIVVVTLGMAGGVLASRRQPRRSI